MTRSIPEHSIERVFGRMEHIYGARFHDMWRSVEDFKTMKAVWREGLADMSDESIRRGISRLFHEKSPPTLPRFIELCHAQAMSNTSTQPALAGPRVITPAAHEALMRIKGMLAPLNAKMIVKPSSIELPAAVPSPHIYGDEAAVREPGEDDE